MYKKDILIYHSEFGIKEINLPENFELHFVDWIKIREAIQKGIENRCRFLVGSRRTHDGEYFVQLHIDDPVHESIQPVDFSWFIHEENIKNLLLRDLIEELEMFDLKIKEDGFYYSE